MVRCNRRRAFTAWILCLLLLGQWVFLASCGRISLPWVQVASPTPTHTSSPGHTPESQATSTPEPTRSELSNGEAVLKLWLPPRFDPASGSQAGELLKARLNAFADHHPGVRFEVRVKAEEGPGGMLDALSSATVAAPLALPDLVALPRPVFEAAALKGLLRPLDGLTKALAQPDWYAYARQLARLQDSLFGLPFAGDVLLLAYHPTIIPQPPRDWTTTLSISSTLVIPASDPQSLFTLALYQSSGGRTQDVQGRPALDPATLERVLAFYQQAERVGRMPYWLTQYETESQAWETFQAGQATLAVTWASRYLELANSQPGDLSASWLPTETGQPYTLATGWVWALANPRPDHQSLSVQLAEFLTEGHFLAEWTGAAGFLPPRSEGVEKWQGDAAVLSLVEDLSNSARLLPSADQLSSLGPSLKLAVVQVLLRQADPATAARTAAERLAAP